MDMKKMMRQAQKMQAQLTAAQNELKDETFEASAGGGMVKVVVTGEMMVKSVTIDPIAIDPDDPEMLQDMIMAATNEALRGMADITNNRMNAITGGMNLPGF